MRTARSIQFMRSTQANERKRRHSKKLISVSLPLRVLTVILLLCFEYQTSGLAAYVEARDARGPVPKRQDAPSGRRSIGERGPAKPGVELQTARAAKEKLKEIAGILRRASAGSLSAEMRAVIERHLGEADTLWQAYFTGRETRLRDAATSDDGDFKGKFIERSSALRADVEHALKAGTKTDLLKAAARVEATLVVPASIAPASLTPFSMRPMPTKSGAGVVDRSAKSAGVAHGQEPSIAPPTPADLADAVDAAQCAEIVALANSLDRDPLKLYEYVRHHIDYEPYYGLRKGACETLLSLSGNSFDQASLLIALLRASGIPARFARGVVEIPASQAAGMMGLNDASLASTMIQSSGVPATSILGGGGIIAVRMERAWVEAYVPYSNYRGVPNDSTGPIWIPLDPSFKQFIVTPAIDVAAASGLDITNLAATLTAASTFDSIAGQVVGVDQGVAQQQFDLLAQRFNDTLDSTFGTNQATASDVLGSKIVVRQLLGMLPSSLPYDLKALLSEGAALPANLRYSITVQVADAVFTMPMAALNGKPLTVAWPAASGTPPPDSIFAAVPTIRLGGVPVASGSSVNTGTEVGVTLTYSAPNQSPDQVTTSRQAGEMLSVVLDLGRLVPSATQAASAALQAATNDVDRAEWLLTTIGRTYFMEVDSNVEMSAAFNHIRYLHEVFGGIVSEVRATEFAFGVPVGTSYIGVNIDIARQILTPFSKVNDPNAPRFFLLSAGQSSSTVEHSVFTQLLQADALSTTKILQLANQAHVPVYRINATNAATIVPLLTHNAAMIATVNQEVTAGRVISIPRDPITYFDWTGTGYITEDPLTGAAAYMISGGLAGHMSTTAGGSIAKILLCVVALVGILSLIPFPGNVGLALAFVATISGIYDIFVSNVSLWRKALAAYVALAGIEVLALAIMGLEIAFWPALVIGVVLYGLTWLALGGNPIAPCLPQASARQRGSLPLWPACSRRHAYARA